MGGGDLQGSDFLKIKLLIYRKKIIQPANYLIEENFTDRRCRPSVSAGTIETIGSENALLLPEKSSLPLKRVTYLMELSPDFVELFGSPNRYFPQLHNITLSTLREGAELLLVTFAV